MSRGLLRGSSDICADCNASDPTWASINRGVFICDECCSVHRSLGRHVSQVRSLKKGSWSSAQLAMVHHLVSFGANNIWEYALLYPSQNKPARRKPNPRDAVHPTKADFIRAKYQFLAFVNKQKDSEVTSVDDLSKQLHSSVRTGNLETSLRLLSLGADPNYFHTEKGSRPLHVAAQANQASQVELLVVYGADPGAFDTNGKTPVEHAKLEGHTDLADRLRECQYELTDRLAFYLCGRKPDHRTGQHFIIPEMADSSLDLSELAKAAKKKLQALSNHLFEELAMDVYDEVDRRENETIWLSTQNHSTLVSDRQTVPFLPVNPEFSSTRNQGRQKLARFNAREFATLIIDILSDVKRRQQGVTSPMHGTLTKDKEKPDINADSLQKQHLRPDRQAQVVKSCSIISDDEPLYDSVASDEDYASIGDNQSLKEEKPVMEASKEVTEEDMYYGKRDSSPTSIMSFTESMASSDQSDVPITLEEYLDVKRNLAESQARILQMAQTNKDLKQEITLLHNMIARLMQENHAVKSKDFCSDDAGICYSSSGGSRDSPQRIHKPGSRPQSMYEARDQQRYQHWHKPRQQTLKEEEDLEESNPKNETGSKSSSQSSVLSQPHSDLHNTAADSDYDNANPTTTETGSARSSGRSDSVTPTEGSQSGALEGAVSVPVAEEGDIVLPRQDEVVKKTEKITKKIQELLISAQEGKHVSYVPCSEKIHTAVIDMAALFPQNIQNDKIQSSLSLLNSGADRLADQCSKLPPEGTSHADSRLHTQQVIQCAYDIAKAAKQLVILFE